MIHKIISVTFYQTVTFHEKSIKGKKAFNTLDEVMLKGIKISRAGESIVLEHDDFETSYCVGMANVRHYRFEKEVQTEFTGDPADYLVNDSRDLVNSSQYENTDAVIDPIGTGAMPSEKKDQGETAEVKASNNKNLKKIKSKKVKKKTKKTKKKVSKKCTAKKKKNS